MGAHLVSAVHTRWTHVSDRAFRVLSKMALTVLDKPSGSTPAGYYFAGRDPLAMALRPPWPDGDSDQAERERDRLRRAVADAVAELVKEGAVVRAIDHAHTGRRMPYWVLPDESTGTQNPGISGTPNPGTSSADWYPESGTTGTRNPGALGEIEDPLLHKELSRKDGSALGVTHSRGHRAVRAEEDRSEEGTDVCPACGVLLDPGRVCGNRRCPSYGRPQ